MRKEYSTPDLLDEETLKQIAYKTDGEYYRAESSHQLNKIYEKLGTELVMQPQRTELTHLLTGLAVILVIIAGILSLLWFNQIS